MLEFVSTSAAHKRVDGRSCPSSDDSDSTRRRQLRVQTLSTADTPTHRSTASVSIHHLFLSPASFHYLCVFRFFSLFYVSLQNLILSSVSFHVSRLSPLPIPFFRFAQPFPCLSTIYAVFPSIHCRLQTQQLAAVLVSRPKFRGLGLEALVSAVFQTDQ